MSKFQAVAERINRLPEGRQDEIAYVLIEAFAGDLGPTPQLRDQPDSGR
jgi:hypothetical protein